MRLFELAYACRLYGEFTDFDHTFSRSLADTAPAFDILDRRHREALLVWLNSWGCRQFALDFHDEASEHLRNWGQENLSNLPDAGTVLLEQTDSDLAKAGILYAGLRDLQASVRRRSGKSYPVTVGPTGAAKIMFALRNDVFPPWDEPIRARLDYDGSQESYIRYLQWVRRELHEVVADAETHGLAVRDIPNVLGRPLSSLAKLVDEHNWVIIAKGCTLPNLDVVGSWWRWASPASPPSGGSP